VKLVFTSVYPLEVVKEFSPKNKRINSKV